MLPRNSRDCTRTAAIAWLSDDSSATLSRSAGEEVIFAPGRRRAQIEQRQGDNPKHPRSCESGPWWQLVFEGARAARVIPLSNDNRLAARCRAAWHAVERSASVSGGKDRFSMNRFATNATKASTARLRSHAGDGRELIWTSKAGSRRSASPLRVRLGHSPQVLRSSV